MMGPGESIFPVNEERDGIGPGNIYEGRKLRCHAGFSTGGLWVHPLDRLVGQCQVERCDVISGMKGSDMKKEVGEIFHKYRGIIWISALVIGLVALYGQYTHQFGIVQLIASIVFAMYFGGRLVFDEW
jgi:hypothetical protein